MTSLELIQNYILNNENDTKTLKPKELVDEVFDLYKRDIITEKSFKLIMKVLLESFIENNFNKKYLQKLIKLEKKITLFDFNMGSPYERR